MKILLVENESTVVNAIIRLHKAHHDFIPVLDLDDALDYVRDNEPVDLIMLDLRMNGKGRIGLEVYELARQRWGKDILVAVITGCENSFLDRAEEDAKVDLNFIVYRKPLINDKLKLIFSTAEDHLKSLKNK